MLRKRSIFTTEIFIGFSLCSPCAPGTCNRVGSGVSLCIVIY